MLADRTEVGNFYIPDRGQCDNGARSGEYIPEHVHHNYKHTNAYVESRERRGKEGADRGQFLEPGQWSRMD